MTGLQAGIIAGVIPGGSAAMGKVGCTIALIEIKVSTSAIVIGPKTQQTVINVIVNGAFTFLTSKGDIKKTSTYMAITIPFSAINVNLPTDETGKVLDVLIGINNALWCENTSLWYDERNR